MYTSSFTEQTNVQHTLADATVTFSAQKELCIKYINNIIHLANKDIKRQYGEVKYEE